MTRVLFVDHVDRILGGAEINLLELLPELLADPTLQIACACAPSGPLGQRLRELGVRQFPHHLPPAAAGLRVVGRRFSPAAALRAHAALRDAQHGLEKTLADFQPSVVISIPNKDHFCAGAACQRARIPSLWWVNDILAAPFFSWPVRALFVMRARRLATQLITVSDYARQILLNQCLAANRVRTIHNGIPIARYASAPPGHLHRLLQLPPTEPLIGVVGRFTPWKGQELFLRLAGSWIRDHSHGHFVLIGQAFNEEQAFADSLKKNAANLNHGNRIHFVPFQADAPAVFRDLAVLLHTSLSPEPFGRVIIEAMAAGTPVIAARHGGVPEIITDGVNGYLAPPGDADAYLAALRKLWAGQPNTALIAAARHTVNERFSIQRVATAFRQLIAQAAPGHAPATPAPAT